MQRDKKTEHEFLAQSRLFEENSYRSKAGTDAQFDPIEHYLVTGWLIGLEPNDEFPGSLLQPYFASAGFLEPPAITWLTLRSAGWPLPATKAELLNLADTIRSCELFDQAYYREHIPSGARQLDPAIHYAVIGEWLGIAPSPHFDPAYYRERHPDVPGAGLSLLLHFVEYGPIEGRTNKPLQTCRSGKQPFFPARENVLLVVHEASRTGAPILGWNIALHLNKRFNVFTLYLGDGELVPHLEAQSVKVFGPYLGMNQHSVELDYSLRDFFRDYKLRYAIVNSMGSSPVLEVLSRRFVCTVFLVHEFASYMQSADQLPMAFDWATQIIFPASIVAQAAHAVYPLLSARQTHIIPQGVSLVPDSKKRQSKSVSVKELDELIYAHDVNGTFIVVGAGTVELRKGTDVFLAAAAAVLRRQPARAIHFIWVGHGFRPTEDIFYSVYLQEQLGRSGLTGHVTFLEEVSDLQPIYQIADAFFLSSRLDPMPNVSIDAASQGIPIICFREASGIADLLLSDPHAAIGVVDYLDADAAGRVITEFARNESLRQRVGNASKCLAVQTFDMDAYVTKLDELGAQGQKVLEQRAADAEILLDDSSFDHDMYIGPVPTLETRREALVHYLAVSEARGRSNEKVALAIRRPAPGFHPLAYATLIRPELPFRTNPLADYIKRCKPKGPWQAQVLDMDEYTPPAVPVRNLRTVLHGHFYYPELVAEFLEHLDVNQRRCDLLITTDRVDKAQLLERWLANYRRGTVSVRVMPNKGRNIGPLLTGLARDLAKYDLVGHIHSKRTLEIDDGKLGDAWRTFLWQHLLGGRYPMIDRVLAAFEHDDSLGLVFPCDPHLVGWDANRKLASSLASRMGWNGQLPEAFDFPLGAMFWSRREALEPLFALGLQWEDYPLEPVPYDGTLLHALERLISLSNQLAGYSHAVTHISGVWW